MEHKHKQVSGERENEANRQREREREKEKRAFACQDDGNPEEPVGFRKGLTGLQRRLWM